MKHPLEWSTAQPWRSTGARVVPDNKGEFGSPGGHISPVKLAKTVVALPTSDEWGMCWAVLPSGRHCSRLPYYVPGSYEFDKYLCCKQHSHLEEAARQLLKWEAP